jgi:hypothetical protein
VLFLIFQKSLVKGIVVQRKKDFSKFGSSNTLSKKERIMKKWSTILILGVSILMLTTSVQAVELKLARFFGTCEEKSTDIAAQSGEACIIEAIIRNFSEQDNGITVNEMPADWGSYYDQIKNMDGGRKPAGYFCHAQAPYYGICGDRCPGRNN